MMVPLLVLLGSALGAPSIQVLGTVDLLLVETTPLVIEDRLWRFESVRPEYWNNTLSSGPSGPSYFRFVDVATGEATPSFATNHALGCAVYDENSKTVYAFGTTADSSGGGRLVDVFWSDDGMKTWQSQTAVDFGKFKKIVFNTSVSKGKLNGKDVWVMAYETSIAGTPGGWNTAFATAPSAKGPWTVLDDSTYRMSLDVEHADPALRYMDDGYWYCIPARKTPIPTPNGGWYFFTEIFRSRDLKEWESGAGMGSKVSVGSPLLKPNATTDQAVAPAAPADEPADGSGPSGGWITAGMANFLSKMRTFFSKAEDVNTSDMDLCEWRNRTVMYFCWGEQHTDNGLALAVADMPLAAFLQEFFKK